MTEDTSRPAAREALQARAASWHTARFPRCTIEDIALKSMAELGEVADAILAEGRDAAHPERAGTVLAESADVVVTLLAICGRFGHGDLLAAVDAKLTVLGTPGAAHPGCLPVDDHEYDEGYEAASGNTPRGDWLPSEVAAQSASWQLGYRAGRG